MEYRLTIDRITPHTREWTSKVQETEKPRPRESKDGRTRFQILLLEDEKEQQVAAVLYGEDIEKRGQKLNPFCTYLISTAKVRLPLPYGVPVNKYEWVLDKFTIIEEVKTDNVEDSPLPGPTRLHIVPFADLHEQPLKSEFDILAVVVNCGSIKYAGTYSNKCCEVIVMDSSMQPTMFSLWEDYAEIDGSKIAAMVANFPVIVAKRITRIQYGGSSLSTRYNSIILIDPPYPQATELAHWVRQNEETLNTYRQRSSLRATASPALVSARENVTPIADLSLQSPIQVFHVEVEMSVPNANQDFYELICSDCGHQYRTSIRKKTDCVGCGQEVWLAPRSRFEVELADGSGSVTATLSSYLADNILEMTAAEVYEMVTIKKQPLPLHEVRRCLSNKLFQIQLKKAFSRGSELRLFIMSYNGKPATEIGESSGKIMTDIIPTSEPKKPFDPKNLSPSKRQQVEQETLPNKK